MFSLKKFFNVNAHRDTDWWEFLCLYQVRFSMGMKCSVVLEPLAVSGKMEKIKASSLIRLIQPRARPFSRLKGSRSQILQTINPSIVRTLSGSPNCAWYLVAPVWSQGIPLTCTFSIVHTRCLGRASNPPPSRYATCDATGVGFKHLV